jgi:hypothetical protein
LFESLIEPRETHGHRPATAMIGVIAAFHVPAVEPYQPEAITGRKERREAVFGRRAVVVRGERRRPRLAVVS